MISIQKAVPRASWVNPRPQDEEEPGMISVQKAAPRKSWAKPAQQQAEEDEPGMISPKAAPRKSWVKPTPLQEEKEKPAAVSAPKAAPRKSWVKPPPHQEEKEEPVAVSAEKAAPRKSWVKPQPQEEKEDPAIVGAVKAAPRKSWQKSPTAIALKKVDTGTVDEKRESLKEAPYQLRHLKQNWNLKYVPKGNVADRMKIFSKPNRTREEEDPELTNTGRVNPALRKRRELERQQERERQAELEARRERAESKYGFGRTKKAKEMAATDIQSIIRMHLVKAIVARKREQAEARAKKDQRLAEEQTELDRQTKAAVKIQAIMRSAVTRLRVTRMVEDMIAGLLKKQEDEDRRLQNVEGDAAALMAAKQKQQAAEKERQAQAALDEARRLKELEGDAAALAAEKRKQQEAEEERLALAALAREQREATVDELAQERNKAEAEKEAQRLAKLEAERARREDTALERERRRKAMKLFTGPLPWGVALLPDWWMAEAPHNNLFLDSITEDSNGEEFEDWRKENLKQEPDKPEADKQEAAVLPSLDSDEEEEVYE
jgi:hypothetical protein